VSELAIAAPGISTHGFDAHIAGHAHTPSAKQSGSKPVSPFPRFCHHNGLAGSLIPRTPPCVAG
jgi:hypothetical protein